MSAESAREPQVPIIERDNPRGLLQIVEATTDRFIAAHSTDLTILGDTPSGIQAVKQAIRFHTFPDRASGLYPENVGVTDLLDLVRDKERVIREALLRETEESDFGLKSHELALLRTFCRAGDAAEDLYIDWQQDMDELGWQEHVEDSSLTLPIKPTNIYTIPVENPDGTYREETWAVRYRNQVAQVTKEYSHLAEELSQMENLEAQHLRQAVLTFIAMLSETDIHEMEKRGDEFDRAWMTYQGQIQFIFPRDDGYAGWQAYPEIRLILVDKDQERARETSQIEDAVGEYLDTLGNGELVNLYRSSLRRTQLVLSDYLNETGISTLRPAAESLPNAEGPRQEEGTRVYIMLETIKQRWKELAQVIDRFDEETQALYFDFDYETHGTFDVIGHELGEPFAETLRLRTMLGSILYGHINEDMATKFATVAARRLDNTNPGILKNNAIYIAFSTIRYIARALKDPTLQNYMVMAYKELDELITTGIISITDEGKIHFDFSPGKIEAWSMLSEANLNKLAGILERGQTGETIEEETRHEVEGYLSIGAGKWDMIQRVIKIVHPLVTSEVDLHLNKIND